MNLHADARYVDEEAEVAYRGVLLSTLDRIATALEQLAKTDNFRATALSDPEVSVGEAPYGDPSQFVPYAEAPAHQPGPVVVQTWTSQQPYVPEVHQTVVAGPPPWGCPEHHQVKTVPADVSKKTGKPYDAFLACPVRECNHVARRCRVAGCVDASRA